MNQAIADALVPYGTVAQRDAAIAAALAGFYDSTQTDAAITAALVHALRDRGRAGLSHRGGAGVRHAEQRPDLERRADLQPAPEQQCAAEPVGGRRPDRDVPEARSETYTQLETGAAITAAIDALDLSQFQNEAEVQALIAAALVPYWDQGEVSSFVAGELSNYATSSSVTSAISSALSSYDNSSQVDSKIITALLDFYTRAEVDQEIADALGNVDLSSYYTSAQTDSLFYLRTELDSLLTATLLQYWTSGRTQTEIDDAIAGAGFLTQAQADTRYFAVSANASFESLDDQGPPAPGAPGGQHHPHGHHARAHLRRLYESGSGRALPEQQQLRAARRQVLRSEPCGGRGQRHLPPRPGAVHAPLHKKPALPAAPHRGGDPGQRQRHRDRGGLLEQGPERRPLPPGGHLQLPRKHGDVHRRPREHPGDGRRRHRRRVTALENSGGVAPTADLTVNSLTATTFVETPQLQSAAGDLQIQNALVTVRKEDGALLASFADGGISLDRDVTVAAASTLNATTADITQLTVGSTAATGAFNSNSSVTANLEVVSNLRLEAPLVRCDPTAPWLLRRASWSTTPSWSTGPSPRRPACHTCSSPAAPRGWR